MKRSMLIQKFKEIGSVNNHLPIDLLDGQWRIVQFDKTGINLLDKMTSTFYPKYFYQCSKKLLTHILFNMPNRTDLKIWYDMAEFL